MKNQSYKLEGCEYLPAKFRSYLTSETTVIVDELLCKAPIIECTLKKLFIYIGSELIHPHLNVNLYNHIIATSGEAVLSDAAITTRGDYFTSFIDTVTEQLQLLFHIMVYVHIKSDNIVVWDILTETLTSFLSSHKGSVKRVKLLNIDKELPQSAQLLTKHLFMSKITNRTHLQHFGIPNFDEPKTFTFEEAFNARV
jgi:hypothetical protein